MQSKTGFPSSHQSKSYVAPKSRLKFAARCPVSGCWPSCWISVHAFIASLFAVNSVFYGGSLYNRDLVSTSSYRTQWTAEGSVFCAVCLWCFCLCIKFLGNRWTDLLQLHAEDVFGHSLGWFWSSRSKVRGQGHQGQKRHFSLGPFGGLRAVDVW